MESLSIGLSTSLPCLNYPKTQHSISKPAFAYAKFFPNCNSSCKSFSQHHNFLHTHSSSSKETPLEIPDVQSTIHVSTHFWGSFLFLKPHLSILSMGFVFPVSCFASEIAVASEEVSTKINLEAILVSIDEFFNRNPFFVAGVTFIWLVVMPLLQEYFRKYKFISALDGFRKLRDDPKCQLLDIRDKKSLAFVNSPNLKILNKSVLQLEFREGDEDGFVKQVLENFEEPENTTICSFVGNSMKVAELLVRGGIKEAYAIKGGVRGKKGWQEIQETLLPPSTHIYAKKVVKVSQQLKSDGEVERQKRDRNSNSSAYMTSLDSSRTKNSSNGSLRRSDMLTSKKTSGPRSSSPYPNV